MRASFLLIASVALLIGLGVAVLVKVSGILNPAPVVTQPPPAAPPPPALLVAARNLYAGDTIRTGDVQLRPARPDEVKDYLANRPRYLPPALGAAYYRLPNKNIAADTPLLKEDLQDMNKPEPLHTRLPPWTRAVNVAATKPNSAGGLVQVGDWVDVYLTTQVGRSDEPGRFTQTALIAHNALVVAKRDTLWTVFAAQPSDLPIQYTLAVNPYRAALIDYARTKGTIALQPVSVEEKRKLDRQLQELHSEPSQIVAISIPDAESPEYKEEEKRLAALNRGEASIGAEDLIRILGLKPLQPATPPLTVEYYGGVQRRGTVTFSPRGAMFTKGEGLPALPHYEFSLPPGTETPAPAAGASGARPRVVQPVPRK